MTPLTFLWIHPRYMGSAEDSWHQSSLYGAEPGACVPREQNQHLRKVTLRQEREESQWNQATAPCASWDFPEKTARWTEVWVFALPLTPAGQWGRPQEWGRGSNRGLPTSFPGLLSNLSAHCPTPFLIHETHSSFRSTCFRILSPKTCHAGLRIKLKVIF